jgi:diaminohydroxyphosphoribosylaminopyrimidine deaminase/5-amino-6-(5-phosphoribosylamino)uracil reductase
LGKRGVLQVLCEGGGTLAGSLLRRNLVDEAWLFMAPRLLGDQARPAVAGARWRLDELPTLRITGATMVGEDVLIKAVRREF